MPTDTHIVGFRAGGADLFPVTKTHFDALPGEEKYMVITPSTIARNLTQLDPQQQGQILHDLWNQISWQPDPDRHLGHPSVMENFVKFVIRFLAEEDSFDGRSSLATIEMARAARRIIAEDISRGFRGDYAEHIDLADEEEKG